MFNCTFPSPYQRHFTWSRFPSYISVRVLIHLAVQNYKNPQNSNESIYSTTTTSTAAAKTRLARPFISILQSDVKPQIPLEIATTTKTHTHTRPEQQQYELNNNNVISKSNSITIWKRKRPCLYLVRNVWNKYVCREKKRQPVHIANWQKKMRKKHTSNNKAITNKSYITLYWIYFLLRRGGRGQESKYP